jgi:predicted phage terminase large subunit-like protein
MTFDNPIEVKAELCKRDFYYFLQEFWGVIVPEEPIYNWHIKYLCDELQIAAERVFKGLPNEYDLLINIPPGTTKTTICIVMYPVWIWLRMPQARVLTLNYSATGATDKSSLSKDIIKSDKFKLMFPDIEIRQDIDNKETYKTIQGGERVAKGIKGSVLSGHYHFILADDPLNITEAASKLKRDTTNSMLNKIATTRKVDKKLTFTAVIMQRLHEDDPSGMLLAKEGYKLKHINLPAKDNGKIKPNFLKLKYVNGLLDPVRLDETVLSQQLIGLGSYDYAGQFDQEPAPSDGGMIQKSWFKFTTLTELNELTKQTPLVWNFEIDGAFTSDKKNAQTVIFSWAQFQNKIYVRHVLGVWEETNDFLKTLIEYLPNNGYTNQSKIYIENKASGIIFLQVLRNQTMLNVVSEVPKGSKEERVKAALPVLEAERCVLIKGDWNESFIDQCGAFPMAKLKDKVDTLTAAINRLSSKENSIQEWSIL